MNCDPSSLQAAAKCLCFQGQLDDCVKTYLLCQWANGAGAAPDVLPDGARYDDITGEYDIQPFLTPGATYRATMVDGTVQPVAVVYAGFDELIHIGAPVDFVAPLTGAHLETLDGMGELVNVTVTLIADAPPETNPIVGGTADTIAKDDMESYADAAVLNLLNGGENWTSSYDARDSFAHIYADEDFESYPNASTILDGWDQGTGWPPGSAWRD